MKQSVNYKWGDVTGISNVVKGTENAIQYTCDQNIVNFYNLDEGQKVNVYSVNGQLAASFMVGENGNKITLDKGFYIVKCGSAVTKIAVR